MVMTPARLGAALCIGLIGVLFASCAAQGPAIVTTAEQAIQLGQKACAVDEWGRQPGLNWQARHRPLRNDIWQVWTAGPDNRWTPDGRHVEVWNDGRVGECTEIVSSTG
jgi:hypothetical protein